MRTFLIALAAVLAVFAAGLVFGWPIAMLDDFGWRKHALGWLALSLAAYCLSWVTIP